MKFNIEISIEDQKSNKSIVLTHVADSEEPVVGKVYDFHLTNGEKAQYMVQRVDEDGYLCMLVDCLPKEYRMNKRDTNKGGYSASSLRNMMKTEILDLFPSKMCDHMIPFSNGDLLRLPTEKEIFGRNKYGKTEPKSVQQFEPMKIRCNHIAFRVGGESLEWYWLQNKVKDSESYFVNVTYHGFVDCSMARSAFSIRPVFKIDHLL